MGMKSPDTKTEVTNETAVDAAINRLSATEPTVAKQVELADQMKDSLQSYYIKYGKPMSRYEIDLDKRISVAGLLQAVASSPVICGIKGTQTVEGALEVIDKMATGLIELNKKLAGSK